jgi:hypothetical protein
VFAPFLTGRAARRDDPDDFVVTILSPRVGDEDEAEFRHQSNRLPPHLAVFDTVRDRGVDPIGKDPGGAGKRNAVLSQVGGGLLLVQEFAPPPSLRPNVTTVL